MYFIEDYIFSIILTIVTYLLFPLIFAKTRKKPITKKKYKTFCYIINIVLAFALKAFLYFELGSESTSFLPYLLWTCIFTAIGANILRKKHLLIEEGYAPATADSTLETQEIKKQMKNILQTLMLQYLEENPYSGDDVVPIFSDTEIYIRKIPNKELIQTLSSKNISLEETVLNMLHNHTMINIKKVSGADFIKGCNHAYNLYDYINNLKYKKGYINEKTYEENKILGTKLAMILPGERFSRNPFSSFDVSDIYIDE